MNKEVTEFIAKLNHPLEREINELRSSILSAGEELVEHIKWNAPSYYSKSLGEKEDRITFNFPPKKKTVRLIFHRGSQKRTLPEQRLIRDEEAVLKWITNDRAMIEFSDMEEIRKQKESLNRIIHLWMIATHP